MAQFRMYIPITLISRYYSLSSGTLSVLNTKTLAIIHSETTATRRLQTERRRLAPSAAAPANLIDTGK